MGECNYFFKARFANAEEAKASELRLAELLAEGEKAYLFWQESRPSFLRNDPNRLPQSSDTFWRVFRVRFPLTVRYLGDLADIEDWNNGLAGQLGSLVDPKGDGALEPNASLRRNDVLLLLQLNGIWHCSDMTLLEQYCLEDLGAVRAGSISDEEFDSDEDEIDPSDAFDAIDV